MKVINVRGLRANDPTVYYCGRSFGGWKGSALCNRHPLGRRCDICQKNHTREESITAFMSDFWKAIIEGDDEILAALWDLTNPNVLALGCWCAPLACHCDVIISALKEPSVQQKLNEWIDKLMNISVD